MQAHIRLRDRFKELIASNPKEFNPEMQSITILMAMTDRNTKSNSHKFDGMDEKAIVDTVKREIASDISELRNIRHNSKDEAIKSWAEDHIQIDRRMLKIMNQYFC